MTHLFVGHSPLKFPFLWLPATSCSSTSRSRGLAAAPCEYLAAALGAMWSVTSPRSGGQVVAPCTVVHHLLVLRVNVLVEPHRGPTVAVPRVSQAFHTVNVPQIMFPASCFTKSRFSFCACPCKLLSSTTNEIGSTCLITCACNKNRCVSPFSSVSEYPFLSVSVLLHSSPLFLFLFGHLSPLPLSTLVPLVA